MGEGRESDRIRGRLKSHDQGVHIFLLLLLGGGLVAGLLDGSLGLLPYLVGVAVMVLAGHLWEKRSLQGKLIEAEIKEHQEDEAEKQRPPRRLEDHEFFKSLDRP